MWIFSSLGKAFKRGFEHETVHNGNNPFFFFTYQWIFSNATLSVHTLFSFSSTFVTSGAEEEKRFVFAVDLCSSFVLSQGCLHVQTVSILSL